MPMPVSTHAQPLAAPAAHQGAQPASPAARPAANAHTNAPTNAPTRPIGPTAPLAGDCRSAWQSAYAAVRQHSQRLTAGLSAEDQALQSMADASPTKWHLAHTTWFFETLVLRVHVPGYRPVDARWAALFNSYYESLGPRHPRPQRGLLSRPSLAEVWQYRQQVDAAVQRFIGSACPAVWDVAASALRLGLHHEQQHQELLLTDILHAFSLNPLRPAYAETRPPEAAPASPGPADVDADAWLAFDGGPVAVGHAGTANAGFAFDNERPRHTVWLAPFALARRLVNCGDYADFIADGGYRQPALWLSDGWAQVQAQGWQAPAGWLPLAADGSARDGFEQFTLHGVLPLDPAAPVCQLSGYEAAAFAAWAGARLPTEFEWEHGAQTGPAHALHGGSRDGDGGGDVDGSAVAPRLLPVADAGPADPAAPLRQLLGQVWQWTSSAYAPYPGFRPLAGPAAEYNGKFMINQLVLRGSSFATPPGHARISYRNFFPPAARWQFSGLRLARDLPA